jgi:Ser/Thr protein kinase RdoA (MazF antagonist)
VDRDRPPAAILREAGVAVLPGQVHPREGRAWLVDWQGTRAVLRQLATPAATPYPCAATAQVAWLHDFLARLAGLGFPAPAPLPAFGGGSWARTGGALWEIVSFIPGQVVGWADQPGIEEVGELLARYHAAVRRIAPSGQRPGALPLAEALLVLLSPRLDAVPISAELKAVIRHEAGRLAGELSDASGLAGERLVIHGDFTNHNVIADGVPPRVVGVIDFALAHSETPLADIGYGLWRSGRPCQEACRVDPSRASRFLRGYARVARVSAEQAGAIPRYLRGRGLQMIAKRVLAGRAETSMLAQVRWVSANADALADALASAVP